jgi:predicted dehydrogenase
MILDRVEALFEKADEHDVVVIATPNRWHVPIGLMALDAGLPVVIDKPLAATAADGRRLVDAAKDRRVLLTIFQNRRWDGDFLTVRRLIGDGALGPVIRFESRFERWRPTRRDGAWRERGDPEEAGGLLFDLGSHLVDQALVLFGAPTLVYAEVDRRRSGAEVDDDAFVALLHPGGVRAHLSMSHLAALEGPRMRVLGLQGAYEKHGLDVQEEALRAGDRPGTPAWGREPEESWGRLASGDQVRSIETEPGAYPEFYTGLAEALRTGGPPPVDPNDGVAGLEVLEAARESSRSGAVVEL